MSRLAVCVGIEAAKGMLDLFLRRCTGQGVLVKV